MLDHAFVLLVALIYPTAGYVSFRRLLKRVEAGQPVDRRRLYRSTMAWHWFLFAAGLWIWWRSGRPWSDLGFAFEINGRLVIASLLVAACVLFLINQLRKVTQAGASQLARIQSDLGNLRLIVPHGPSELQRFNLLSVTAGIVEETLWRGFLIWYVDQYVPIWAAAVVSAVGFGIAHAYQGSRNLPYVVLVSAVLTGLFLFSGSLWLPMILHAAVDLQQGRLAYETLRRLDGANGATPDAKVQSSS